MINLEFPSYETIKIQHNSPLASSLIAAFEKVEAVRDTETKASARIKKVKQYNKTLEKDIITIFKKYTGITLYSIEFSDTADGSIGIMPLFGTDKKGIDQWFKDVVDAYLHFKLPPPFPSDFVELSKQIYNKRTNITFTVEQLKDIKKMAKAYDRNTGKINPVTYKDYKIGAMLYFDCMSTLLAKETMGSKMDNLNARELAAIVIHEIAHVTSLVEYAVDSYMKTTFLTMSIHQALLSNDISNKDKLEIMNNNINYNKDSKLAKSLSPVIDKLETNIDYERSTWWQTSISFVLGVIMLVISPFTILGLIATNVVISAVELLFTFKQFSLNRYKESDILGSRNNEIFNEYHSDDLAFRHGLGADLASGLTSLVNNFKHSLGYKVDTLFMLSVAKFICIFEAMMLSAEPDFDEHETNHRRIEMLMNSSIELFRDKVSPEILDYYIKDYERMKKTLPKSQNVGHRMGIRIKLGINTLLRLLTAPLSNDITGTIKSINDDLMAIGGNLYYAKARLTRLANNQNKG